MALHRILICESKFEALKLYLFGISIQTLSKLRANTADLRHAISDVHKIKKSSSPRRAYFCPVS